MEENEDKVSQDEHRVIERDEGKERAIERNNIAKRQEKVKNWLSNPYNLALIGILAFAFIIRLYYFLITKTQPLWWDEASYGTIAKTIFSGNFDLTLSFTRELIIRPILLPFFWGILYHIGFHEVAVRFILILTPSLISVFLVYLIAKELYGKKVALFSCFLFSILWIHLFYSMRLLTGAPALFFSLLSIYFFVKSYKKDFKLSTFFLSIFFLSLAILMRYPNAIIGFVYFIFMIYVKKLKILRTKAFWLGGILGGIPILLFFLYNFTTQGSFFPALTNYSTDIAQIESFAFYTFNFIPGYLMVVFFIFFLIGLAICLLDLILGFDMINKNKKLRNHFFLILILLVTFGFFVFVIKAAEDRYLFPAMIPFMVLTSLGLIYSYNFLKKYNKILAIAFIIVVLAFGSYQQFKYADPLIKVKKDSFSEMKKACLWLKDNSNPEDTIISNYAELYASYYADRNAYPLPVTLEEFEQDIKDKKPTFLFIHVFGPQPEYIYNYPEQHPETFEIVNAIYFNDGQPAVSIYRIKHD